MKNSIIVIAIVCVLAGLFSGSGVAVAQTSAAEMLEEARARAREMEELKAVLNGPDQNMRLASFDIMVNSGDEAMRQIAIDTGLASADTLMQAMAFKETVLSLNRIVMSLEIDKSQPADIQARVASGPECQWQRLRITNRRIRQEDRHLQDRFEV